MFCSLDTGNRQPATHDFWRGNVRYIGLTVQGDGELLAKRLLLSKMALTLAGTTVRKEPWVASDRFSGDR